MITRRQALMPALFLLLVAAWFRTWQIERVPPGLHHDEVINAEIAEQAVLAGRPSVFYDNSGQEGLYHLTLAASMRTIGYNPVGMRWPSLAWGMIGLAALYALAVQLTGRRVALIALAFAAASFWSVYAGRAVLRYVSMTAISPLAALAFFAAWRQVKLRLAHSSSLGPRKGKRTCVDKGGERLAFALAGALLGLSLYTYLAARVLPLVFALLVIYLAITQRRTLLAAWRSLLIYLIATVAVGAPLVIYLYVYPTADMRYHMLTQPLTELQQGHPGLVIQATLQTLGMFFWRGDPQWHYNVSGAPIFDPLCAALFVAGLGVALRRLAQLPYLFYLAWLGVSLAPGMFSEPAPHFLRTANAQIAAYVLLGLGSVATVDALAKILKPWPWSKFVWLGLAVVWVVAAIRTYRDYFVAWPANDEVRFYHQANLSDMARHLEARADTTPVVGCSVFLDEHEEWLRSSRQTMHFLLRRADLAIRWNDCRDSLIFPNHGARWRQFILYLTPFEENIPPRLMDWLASAQPVHINGSADITLYMPDVQARLTTVLAQASQAEIEWGPETGGGGARLPADFGHSLAFVGYTVDKAARQAGKNLLITTYWQATGQSPPFLKIFIHLLDGADHVVAQVDRQSVLADTLQPGDVFMQIHTLDLPPDLPPGEYRLSIGLYSSQTDQRLPLYQGQTTRGDRLLLQVITVKPGPS